MERWVAELRLNFLPSLPFCSDLSDIQRASAEENPDIGSPLCLWSHHGLSRRTESITEEPTAVLEMWSTRNHRDDCSIKLSFWKSRQVMLSVLPSRWVVGLAWPPFWALVGQGIFPLVKCYWLNRSYVFDEGLWSGCWSSRRVCTERSECRKNG